MTSPGSRVPAKSDAPPPPEAGATGHARVQTGARVTRGALTRPQMERLVDVLTVVLRGLQGHHFSWGGGQRGHWMHMLAEHGVVLVTRTMLERRGHRLKRGVKPVGDVYFEAPISRSVEVYVLGVQTVVVLAGPGGGP